MENNRPYSGYSIAIRTPEGKLFVHIVEDDKAQPIQIFVNIGKGGSSLAALADATARMASELLVATNIYKVIETLSGTTSDRITVSANGEVVRSVPEGVAHALLKYRAIHFGLNQKKRKRRGND